MYAAKIKIEKAAQRVAEKHQRRALAGTIKAKKAFLKAKVATKNAKDMAALYKKQYYAAIKAKNYANKLTLQYNNKAAKSRHNTRVAYKAVKLANKKAAIAAAKAAAYKVKYISLKKLTIKAAKDVVHYKNVAKKALAGKVAADKKHAKANKARKSWISKTKKALHLVKHTLTLIHKLKVKHTKMVKAAKKNIAKMVLKHKDMLKNIKKHGKAAIHRLVVQIKIAREKHDKQVNWYIEAIKKLNAKHDKFKLVFVSYTKKAKHAVKMTKMYNKLMKIAKAAALDAHKLALKYHKIAETHKKATAVAIHLFKKWTAAAKKAIKARKAANAASVKAIARRVAAEAAYAAQHAKMIVAQKKSHKLRLTANRYRKMVEHHIKMTKKFNAGTKFHKGKEAHWKRLAAAARALAKKYIRHAKEEHKQRIKWIVITKRRVAAEKAALAKARKNNALAAAKEARAKIYAAAAKRATRLAIREHKLRLAAEKRTKNFIKRQEIASKKYKTEEKLKFHYLRLAGQADRKAAREWARHNRHIKEMKYAIKKMIASVANRKRVVKKSMTFVTKQNALMQKANKAAAKHRAAKFVA